MENNNKVPIPNVIIFIAIIIAFTSCKKELVVSSEIHKNETIDSLRPNDERVIKIISPYKNQLDAEMNKIIGECQEEISNKRPELSLTRLLASIILTRSREKFHNQVDFSIMNSGGIRIPTLAAGPITLEKVFEIMPFENQLWVLKLSGELTYKLVKKADESWNLVLGNVLKRSKEGRMEDFIINGRQINIDSTYNLAISDYLALGGDELTFLNDALEKNELDSKIRDEIIGYIENETKAERKIKKQ